MKYLALSLLLLLGSSMAVAQVIYNSASTAGESYARGLSGVIAAQGLKDLSDSQAAINLTDARSSQIDNQLKSVNAFWAKKDVYALHQQQEFAEIDRKRSNYLAKHGLGALTPEEFDRTTGTIAWLKILEQPQYDKYRNTLDSLLKKRAYQGALSGEEYMEASTASREWRAMLAKQRDEYPRNILSDMTRFILKIDRELNDHLS